MPALVLHFASAPSTLTMAPLMMCRAVCVFVSMFIGVYSGSFLKSVLGGVYWWELWEKNFLVGVVVSGWYFVGMGGC